MNTEKRVASQQQKTCRCPLDHCPKDEGSERRIDPWDKCPWCEYYMTLDEAKEGDA